MSMARRLATLIGFAAVLMWALLALLTAASGRVPPFQLAAMSFLLAALVGISSWPFRTGAWRALRQPLPVWLLGVGGLFGYHFFYFTALRNAPPLEAGLIAYLWPLLIVLLSAFLPGERLGWHHLAGALAGLAGTVLVITDGRGFDLSPDYLPGYASAFVGAMIWATYSVLSRRHAAVPTDAVAGFCLATALLAGLCHVALEETVWPARPLEWLAVAGLGLMPVGGAFYAWDHGVKHGDIRIIGASAYVAPLLSTLALVVTGYGRFTTTLAIAALLIGFGALLASRDLFSRRN